MQCRRLKDNFSIIEEADRPKLLEAKDEVELQMDQTKWGLIAEKLVQKGGGKYSVSRTFSARTRRRLANGIQADHLQRQYKKLMVREGMRPPPGIVDHDFDIEISDDYSDD